jgi:hypothetical protein
MPKARLVLHTKYIDERAGLVEMKIYKVPKTPATPDGFKYSLVYIRDGQRLVGYDNHEQKGDHRHHRHRTAPYQFTSVDRLITDFLSDVAAVKKEMKHES